MLPTGSLCAWSLLRGRQIEGTACLVAAPAVPSNAETASFDPSRGGLPRGLVSGGRGCPALAIGGGKAALDRAERERDALRWNRIKCYITPRLELAGCLRSGPGLEPG